MKYNKSGYYFKNNIIFIKESWHISSMNRTSSENPSMQLKINSKISEQESAIYEIIKEVIIKNNLTSHLSQNQQNKKEKSSQDELFNGDFDWKKQVRKMDGGVINDIFMLFGKFVLKIERYITGITAHQPELMKLARQQNVKAPQFIDSGEFNGRRYFLTTRIPGDRLSKYWLKLSQEQKQKIIQDICAEVKKLHSIKFEKYSSQRPKQFDSMFSAMDWFINDCFQYFLQSDNNSANFTQQTKDNLGFIQQYIKKNIDVLKQKLYEEENPVFIHNDLHFDNILYDDKAHEVTGLVDFDFSRQLVIDYQLWHIIDFFYSPSKYFEEYQRQPWRNYKVGNEMKYFKKYYPEIFNCNKQVLCTRLKLYLIEELLNNLQSDNQQLFNQKVQAYFRSPWLENLLTFE